MVVTFIDFPVFAVLVSTGSRGGGCGRSVLFGFDFGFALELLHLGPLILEPNLDDPNAQSSFFGQSFSHFPARLGTDFKRGFELASLRGRQDRPGTFRSSAAIVSRSVAVISR